MVQAMTCLYMRFINRAKMTKKKTPINLEKKVQVVFEVWICLWRLKSIYLISIFLFHSPPTPPPHFCTALEEYVVIRNESEVGVHFHHQIKIRYLKSSRKSFSPHRLPLSWSSKLKESIAAFLCIFFCVNQNSSNSKKRCAEFGIKLHSRLRVSCCFFFFCLFDQI